MDSIRRIISEKNNLQFYIEETESGGVRLLRCYGDFPALTVPEKIGSCTVVEIGDYCFADSAKAIECPEQPGENVRVISGAYLRRLELPDTVIKIGNLAFYNCKGLQELSFGTGLARVESDVFMNCRSLHTLRVRGSMCQETGLKQLLARRMSYVDVIFEEEHRITGRLYYPEYEEYYDEIGPAHIFAMSIRGEGFRARQCFRNGIVDLKGYDDIFEQAQAEESPETLCRMAGYRLAYPAELEEAARQRYREYLQSHMGTLAALLVKEKNIELIRKFAEEDILSSEGMTAAAELASQMEWVQGAAAILKLQREQTGKKPEVQRYTFEDW